MIRSVTLATALMVATPATAAPTGGSGAFMFESGASLLSKCRNKAPEYALACTAYIVGVVDGIKKDIYLGRSPDNCWPARMGAEDVRGIVVKYLKAYPDQRHFPGSLIVSVAMNTSYPCKK